MQGGARVEFFFIDMLTVCNDIWNKNHSFALEFVITFDESLWIRVQSFLLKFST
jgi:hypothetical protein